MDSPATKAVGGNKIIHTAVIQKVSPDNCTTFSQQSRMSESPSLDSTDLPRKPCLSWLLRCLLYRLYRNQLLSLAAKYLQN